ncbi:MAG: dTDP-4-dehydrorhamnose 3,5-epimerase [Pseudomonadota bacterium]
MIIDETELPDVLLVTPAVHADDRGFFLESWNKRDYDDAGIDARFVQDNISVSKHLALRGLHFQHTRPQGKLVRVVSGRIFDVAVDMRRSSEFFGHWTGVELSDANRNALWIPEGFAHGFVALSDSATVFYKCTDYYSPEDEQTIRWDDPALAIDWPIPADKNPVVSDRDMAGTSFESAKTFP